MAFRLFVSVNKSKTVCLISLKTTFCGFLLNRTLALPFTILYYFYYILLSILHSPYFLCKVHMT